MSKSFREYVDTGSGHLNTADGPVEEEEEAFAAQGPPEQAKAKIGASVPKNSNRLLGKKKKSASTKTDLDLKATRFLQRSYSAGLGPSLSKRTKRSLVKSGVAAAAPVAKTLAEKGISDSLRRSTMIGTGTRDEALRNTTEQSMLDVHDIRNVYQEFLQTTTKEAKLDSDVKKGEEDPNKFWASRRMSDTGDITEDYDEDLDDDDDDDYEDDLQSQQIDTDLEKLSQAQELQREEELERLRKADLELLEENLEVREGLVAQLQSLHRQLNSFKQGGSTEELPAEAESIDRKNANPSKPSSPTAASIGNGLGDEIMGLLGDGSKLIICSVENPIKLRRNESGEGWEYIRTQGGLPSAIRAVEEAQQPLHSEEGLVKWISWPGIEVDEASQDGVRHKLENNFDCIPVFLNADLAWSFYHVFCTQVLWPVFHHMQTQVDPMQLGGLYEKHQAYLQANQRFLDVFSSVYEDGDVVMVYDYHLMLLPMLLRRRYPDIKCGFVLNCPFPSSEYWRVLPQREELLEGILGADLVVFHHYDYVRHFLHTCTYLVGIESTPRAVEYDRRVITLASHPLGIDVESYRTNSNIESHAHRLRSKFEGMKVVVGMDDLDYVTGVPQKLMAFESLLEQNPDLRGKVILCQVVNDDNRTRDKRLCRHVDELVGRVNGRFGTATYCPIHFLKNSVPREQLLALYSIADVSLNTSLREGLNLASLEYVACQKPNRPGVLIYSEFAGCGNLLKGAMLVNPFHTEEIGIVIRKALTMSSKRKQSRYRTLLASIKNFSATLWSNRVFRLLQKASEGSLEFRQTPHLNPAYFTREYARARKRMLMFDFRGTLVPFQPIPKLSKPSFEVMAVLENLCQDQRNDVVILSGVSKELLESYFGHLRVCLVAEYGYFLRFPNEPWTKLREDVHLWWMDEVVPMLRYFSDRTPGSFLDVGESCATWHFRDSDEEFGLVQAKLLQLQLEQMLAEQPVQAIMAFNTKYILIRSTGVDKGRAVKSILRRTAKEIDYDMVLIIGDDRTDEDVFKQLANLDLNDVWSVSVDVRIQGAKYHLENVSQVHDLLETLSRINLNNQASAEP